MPNHTSGSAEPALAGVGGSRRQGRVEAGGGVIGDEPERPVAGAGRVFHALQDIGDFIGSVGEEMASETREDVCGAADEIVQASPA